MSAIRWTTIMLSTLILFGIALKLKTFNYDNLLPRSQDQRTRMKATNIFDPGKLSALIYILSQSSRFGKLNLSITSLDEHFNNKYRYPLVIFYEESDLQFNISLVRTFTKNPSLISFQKVKFETPSNVNKSIMSRTSCAVPIGYHHMCRFQAFGVYEQPAMSDVEYAMRLDDDSVILRPIKYDIFEYMRTRNIAYGYVLQDVEEARCVRGLSEAVKAFAAREALAPQYRLPELLIYYNNFEVSEIKLWRSEAYRKFARYIDDLAGIYYHRWGDAPLKTMAVPLLVHKNRTHRFADIGYRHQHKTNA